MIGSKKTGLVIQNRDIQYMREVDVMRFTDREQAKVVGGFNSTTRANARLLALTRAGFLRRFFLGTTAGGQKAFYTLSTAGAQLIGTSHRGLQRRKDDVSITGAFIQHQFLLNELYITVKFKPIPVPGAIFRRWLSFDEPIVPGLIPDAYVELATAHGIIAAFVEVDLGTERSAIWEQKVRKYLHFALSETFLEQFGQERFRVLVVVNSERRMHSLRGITRRLTEKIFWFAAIDAIHAQGFFSPIWFRPNGENAVPLINPLP
jgi:Replication-relaxation